MRPPLPVIIASAVTAAAAFPAAAEVRTFPVHGFERVQLEAPTGVTIRTGPAFSVRADGDAPLIDRLTATVRDGTLVIGMTRKPGWFGSNGKLRVVVTMPRVTGAGLKGVGSIDVDRAEAPQVVFAIDGTGSIDIASVTADRTVLSLSGTGSIEAAGTTRHLDARRSGMGSIDAGKLAARSAVLVSSGMGSLDARVDGPVSIDKSGMGSVSVAGHPRCTIRKSGMGSVDCAKG